MTKHFKAYYVWPRFPSISMSGTQCGLHCKHCNHIYLNYMEPLLTPQQLLQTANQLVNQKAVGFLLSGGCNKQGEMLNLRTLLPTITQIKNETNLIIKLHTGLVDKNLAEAIVSAGIDIASTEIVGSNTTIKEIFDFTATTDTYQQTLINLENAGMPYIVPHICIGLHYGTLQGEHHALQIIKNTCTPSTLVMIVFRPTKGTPLQHTPIPQPQDITTIITHAKKLFPHTDIALGCIRPRQHQRQQIEHAALQAGATRMEIPSKQTLHTATTLGYTIKKIHACCALPQELEPNIT